MPLHVCMCVEDMCCQECGSTIISTGLIQCILMHVCIYMHMCAQYSLYVCLIFVCIRLFILGVCLFFAYVFMKLFVLILQMTAAVKYTSSFVDTFITVTVYHQEQYHQL